MASVLPFDAASSAAIYIHVGAAGVGANLFLYLALVNDCDQVMVWDFIAHAMEDVLIVYSDYCFKTFFHITCR